MPSPRVILVNRYFHPDHSATSQLATDLATYLSSGGWDVVAIAGRQRYDDRDARLPEQEMLRQVRIRRAWSTRFGRSGLAGRSIDYVTFATSAFLLLLRFARRRSVVIAMTDPPMLSVAAACAAGIRGARLVNWLQDLFPEVAEALGVAGRHRSLHALRDWSLRRAAINVAVGEQMAGQIRAIGARAAVLPNWADAAIRPVPHHENSLRKEWELDGRFVVTYSGNLGRAHDVATIAGAIRELEADERIRFLFIGGGARSEELRAAIGDNRGVRFEPYQSRERLSESLSTADAHLISLDPRLEGLIVPSKTYGALAAGRAAIFIGDPEGEVGRLLREAGAGTVVVPGDVHGLADTIRRLAADRSTLDALATAAHTAHAQYAAPRTLARWTELLDEVLTSDDTRNRLGAARGPRLQ